MRMLVHALLIGERLDSRALERESVLAAAPLTIRAGKRGYGVLFRYGAVVLFGLTPAEEAEFLATLTPLTVRPLAAPETEKVDLAVDPDAEERVDPSGHIFVTALAPERLQIVADVLAKSVVLGHYERSSVRCSSASNRWRWLYSGVGLADPRPTSCYARSAVCC
jgi:uncharacterized Rmd1/YagE family protein